MPPSLAPTGRDLSPSTAFSPDPLKTADAMNKQKKASDAAECSVMLVDDHAIWRGGVKSLLEDTEFVVVAEAASGREAVEVARQAQPRLTLLDIRMAGGDGLEALSALKREFPTMAVVMLSTYDNPTFMARAVA